MAAGEVSVKMMVSYGGEIRRCPESGKARYAGGENRLVRIGMSERLRDLRARLASLAGYSDVRIRYAIAADGLDTLRDVVSEHDLWRLVTLLYCCSAGVVAGGSRVRAFLFPVAADDSPVALFPPVPEQESVSTPSMPRAKPKGSLILSVEHAAAASLPTAQSTGSSLYAAGSSSSAAPSREGTGSLIQDDASGFEALLAEQTRSSKKMTCPSSSSADSGFEALAAIAAEQSSSESSSSGASTAGGQAAGNGLEALAAVAQERKVLACPMILVPVVALRLGRILPGRPGVPMCRPSRIRIVERLSVVVLIEGEF